MNKTAYNQIDKRRCGQIGSMIVSHFGSPVFNPRPGAGPTLSFCVFPRLF